MQRYKNFYWERSNSLIRSNYCHDFLSLKNLCLIQCICCNALLECICSWHPSFLKVEEKRSIVAKVLCTHFLQVMLTVFDSGVPFQFCFSVSLQESWTRDGMQNLNFCVLVNSSAPSATSSIESGPLYIARMFLWRLENRAYGPP